MHVGLGKTTQRSAVGWSAALIGGCALGAVNSLSSGLGSPYTAVALAPLRGVWLLQCLAAWLGTRWAWAMFAFAVGWCTGRLPTAMLRGVVGLWLAVLAYYVGDAALGVNATLSTGEIMYWLVIGLVVGPAMAAVGWAAHRPGHWSLLAGLVAPGLMILDTMMYPSGPDSIRPWAQWTVYAAAVVLAVALAVRALRLHARSSMSDRDRAVDVRTADNKPTD